MAANTSHARVDPGFLTASPLALGMGGTSGKVQENVMHGHDRWHACYRHRNTRVTAAAGTVRVALPLQTSAARVCAASLAL